MEQEEGINREKCEKGNDVINQVGETGEQKKGSRRWMKMLQIKKEESEGEELDDEVTSYGGGGAGWQSEFWK